MEHVLHLSSSFLHVPLQWSLYSPINAMTGYQTTALLNEDPTARLIQEKYMYAKGKREFLNKIVEKVEKDQSSSVNTMFV